MTQTLTTEELRQIVETDHVQCGDAAAMARELLANREAQPVVWVMMDDLTDKSIVSTPAYRSKEDAEERTIGQIAPLFTAPPAPAVEEFGARRCCKDKKCNAPIVGYSVDGLCEDCYMEMSKRPAPVVNPEFTGATAVPEEMTKEDAMAFVRERPPFKGSVDCVQATWNACRAAMLAAAPEGGS